MRKILITNSQEPAMTAVPNIFIDEYLTVENPVFVLVYIKLLRQMSAGGEITIKSLAESLQLLDSVVIKALKYWEKKKLIIMEEKDESVTISFLPFPSEPKDNPMADNGDNVIKLPFIAETKPVYSPEELELYRGRSKEVSDYFSMAEKVLGKMLTYSDMNVLFSFHDWLRLPISVIEIMLTYCAENDHRNMRYIEKCALDWASNNIYTEDAANNHLKLYNGDYRAILGAFGHSNRNPIATEIKYMKKWLNEYQMPLEVILEACDKTVMKTGQAKFSYADKIITNWHSEGIRTLQAVAESEEKFIMEKEKNKDNEPKSEPQRKKTAKTKEKPNRFSNFKQRDWDFDEIEKLEQQYLIDSVNTNKG